MRARRHVLVFLSAWAACAVPPLDPTGKLCGVDDLCPPGFSCKVAPGTEQGTCSRGDGGVVYLGCLDAGIGSACTSGTGVCARPGVFECAAGTARCTATPGSPEVESCNGLDDDCDGLTDALPDGGALRDARVCEVQAGVCELSTHACVDGGFEPVCTAASYGPRFQSIESRCDGLDNDCDGRVDVSHPVELWPGAKEPVIWVAVDGGLVGLAAVGSGAATAQRPLLVHFGWDLAPRGAAIDLAPQDLMSASSFAMRRRGDDLFVTWISGAFICSLNCQTSKVVAARIDAAGSHRWLARFPDAGQGPGAVTVGQGELAAPPAIGVSPDGSRVAVLWAASDAGVFSASLSATDGAGLTGGGPLSEGCGNNGPAMPDAGVFKPWTPRHVEVVGIGTGDFLAGWENSVDAGAMTTIFPITALGLVRLDGFGQVANRVCIDERRPNALRMVEGPVVVWQGGIVPPEALTGPVRASFDPLSLILPIDVAPPEQIESSALEVVGVGNDWLLGFVSHGQVSVRRFTSAGPQGGIAWVDAGTAGRISLAPGPGGTVAVSYLDGVSQQAMGVLVCQP